MAQKTNPKEQDVRFEVTGSFLVLGLQPHLAADNGIIGYTTPDGSIIRPCVALEVEHPDGSFTYHTKETEMDEMGLTCLDYDNIEFFNKEKK